MRSLRSDIQEKKSQTYSGSDEERRSQYLKDIEFIDEKSIAYIDESGMNDNEFYPYVWCPVGKRHYEAHPGYRNKRISMIGALTEKKFYAPLMFEGHCNAKVFEDYIENTLIPNIS